MLTILGGALSAVFGGGATGLLGVILQRYFDYLKVKNDLEVLKVKQAHEASMRDKDTAIMEKEWQGRLQVAQQEGKSAENVALTNAFQTSLLREPERYSNPNTLTVWQQWVMVVLDFMRGVVRPLLTLYLCVLTSYIWWQVRQLLSIEDLSQDQVLAVWTEVVETILYLTTTVVLWWFGTRNQQSAPSRRGV